MPEGAFTQAELLEPLAPLTLAEAPKVGPAPSAPSPMPTETPAL
ncbi:hypothetical protein Q675_32295 [Labrenzia sp. C1B70]|nr:hypothetical protein Q675_32295 [Labrenzia sp. C1B70]